MQSRLMLFAAWAIMNLAGHGLAADGSLVASWEFAADQLPSLVAEGDIRRDLPGPRPPEFPDHPQENMSVGFNGDGGHFVIADPGPGSPFDFTNGDAITLEAWVRVDGPRGGSPMYIIGKGRTGSPNFARDNQNWALRLTDSGGAIKLGFLFATTPGAGVAHWHRWTSKSGFAAATGWHHIGVTYQFGDPASIRGWIDGQPTLGTWDLGGPTTAAPVVDDDAIWIGSSQAGNPGNSFRGRLDNVAVHRGLLTDTTMAARFRRVGGPRIVEPQPEIMPEIRNVPVGRVLVTFSEGLPAPDRWPNRDEAWPQETARWVGDAFLLPRIPLRYDAWGIRASWQAPVLIRMAADVDLPPGQTRFLLRARALSRLWVDGVVVAHTDPITKQPPNGEEPITPLAQPPRPGLRVHGYHQQEVFGDVDVAAPTDPAATQSPSSPAARSKSSARRCRVVLELVVGGKNLRTETGEVCVAVQTSGGASFVVLQPTGPDGTGLNDDARDDNGSAAPRHAHPLPLTDAAVEPAIARIERSLAAFDDQTRHAASASQDDYWRNRHAAARVWARQHPSPAPPQTMPSSAHPVDAFIVAKIKQAREAASAVDPSVAAQFHGQVFPILRENCVRCHGEKDKGGLKLDSREAAMRGGDSGLPAVAPGNPSNSELLARIRSDDESTRMPPTGSGLTPPEIEVLEKWVQTGAVWPPPPIAERDLALPPVVGDDAFLRRIFLDTVGVPPGIEDLHAFRGAAKANKRAEIIDRLLADERMADHWMSFWLDLLAENPTLLNASLNSTGPFRWFIYDALRDNQPLDRMVTELILMRGSQHEGGSAGFGMAAENDAPLAAKGHILASAFLGIELQCARCHDSPYHSTTQRELYSLAAMLNRQAVKVPATSRVPATFFERPTREPLIRVTLKPDEAIAPTWPFAEVTGIADAADVAQLMQRPDDSRERLAALITAPQNQRFPQVVVNRLWKRLLGAGIVEPVHDWEGRTVSHPELLRWLAEQLITHEYDLRHVIRLIVSSETYRREAVGRNLAAAGEQRFFNAPDRRRLTAEQIVDSLHTTTGSPMNVEELTFVHDGRRAVSNRLTLGRPTRAWMFASLNNERDRPSLALPRARAVADVLEAFGWTGSRQRPITDRGSDPNVLQPGVLANGTLSVSLTRAAAGSDLAQLAIDAPTPTALVESLFLRILGRQPRPEEWTALAESLAVGFDTRLVPLGEITTPTTPPPLPLVTWFNHLRSEANTIQQEVERRVREGPPRDPRLTPAWREIYEDVVWSLINHREFVWVP